MVGKTIFRIFFLIVAASGLAFPFSAWGAEKVRFATGFRMNASYSLPPLAALEKGFWKQQGVEVDWLPFDSFAVMRRAVAAGVVEMSFSDPLSLIPDYIRGVPIIFVADTGLVTEYFFWVPTGSRLREPKDLKGARIGISRFGVVPHYLGQMVVKNLGLEKEVKFVALGGGSPAIAALKAARVDVILFSDFTLLPLKAKGEVRELLRMYDYLSRGLESSQVVFAHREFAAKQPEPVPKVIAGFFQGASYLARNPAWAVEKMKSYLSYTEEAAQLALALLRYSPDGRIDKAKFEANLKVVSDFLAEYGLIPKGKVPRPAELYTDQFVR